MANSIKEAEDRLHKLEMRKLKIEFWTAVFSSIFWLGIAIAGFYLYFS